MRTDFHSTARQRKTLGLDARKIRKIKDVSGETKALQDKEAERARWEEELRSRGAAAKPSKDIINPPARALAHPQSLSLSHSLSLTPLLQARLQSPQRKSSTRWLNLSRRSASIRCWLHASSRISYLLCGVKFFLRRLQWHPAQ